MAAARATAAEGQRPPAPRGRGFAGSPLEDALFLLSLSKPPLHGPQSPVRASFPQAKASPHPRTPRLLQPLSLRPPSPGVTASRAGRCRAKQAAHCRVPMLDPSPSTNHLCDELQRSGTPQRIKGLCILENSFFSPISVTPALFLPCECTVLFFFFQSSLFFFNCQQAPQSSPPRQRCPL